MGASKSDQFTQEEINLSLAARAFAHPARIAIIHHLKRESSCSNTDLIPVLKLSRATIHEHIEKLHDAGLIKGSFIGSSYMLTLHPNALDHFFDFVTDVVN